MTFFLVMTVYASAVARPNHGNTAPLAIGLSLYASALSGGDRLLGIAWAQGLLQHGIRCSTAASGGWVCSLT